MQVTIFTFSSVGKRPTNYGFSLYDWTDGNRILHSWWFIHNTVTFSACLIVESDSVWKVPRAS